MNTDIIDIEDHNGPKPSEVVLDRFERFVSNPDSFYDAETGPRPEEFQMVRSFLQRVYKLIRPDEHHQSRYLHFIDSECGQSVRIALVMAQNILRVAESDMPDPKASNFIRASVNQGAEQVRFTAKSSIANLFHVQGQEEGRLWINPRILRFIVAPPEQTRCLNEIRQALMPFEYSGTGLVRKAINEFTNIYCQLAYPEGFDSFTEREFQYGGTQQIRLTEAGRGYVNHLLYETDYIQEAMLDCYVQPDRFGLKINTFYLGDKFLLLAKFLNELRLDDSKEMARYVKNSTRDTYFKTFGDLLISLEVICKVADSVHMIVRSIRRSGPSPQPRPAQPDPYDEVLSQLQSLRFQVEQENHKILGIWHNHDDPEAESS